MLNEPRFIKEYASYKRKDIQGLEISDEKKEKLLAKVNRIERDYIRGIVTTDETMYQLLNALSEKENVWLTEF